MMQCSEDAPLPPKEPFLGKKKSSLALLPTPLHLWIQHKILFEQSFLWLNKAYKPLSVIRDSNSFPMMILLNANIPYV